MIYRILVFLLVCLIIATALSFAASAGWPLDLLGQFQAQFVLAGLCLVVFFDFFKRYGAALLALVCMSVALWQMDILNGTRFAQSAEMPGTSLRVATANVFGNKNALDRLADIHQENPFDLIVLTELPSSALETLASRFTGLSQIAGRPEHAVVGQPSAVILSRVPPQALQIIAVNRNPAAIIQVRYCLQGQFNCLTAFALHTPPPITHDYYLRQMAILNTLADRVASTSGPVLVAGDMNAVSWAPQMRNFQEKTQVKKVVCGTRWTPTWLIPVPGLGLELDHMFIKGALTASQCERGADLGSDHWPLYADFQFETANARASNF
ncbi:MAG: endonuclease/exonuclease/phosphatase family protein [Roseibium sp.]|uniref:endonuclease/exonuclease/phosphatase family protein n=1 Tax=Roseibium sp. TaxID=1936156 RepID=UPI001B1EECA3|nr:endonuclease/exonuclease/phosphatase family protein [Roseibium sp.]MBO6892401.1 endonuclease/exonuclease/phosphatase family protein [Roseibium sp.]MBO6928667.1 endonuclease/exonuclease/phosphatase family protein [Roseibium sp.]